MTSRYINNKWANVIKKIGMLSFILLFFIPGCSFYHDSYDAEGHVVDSRTQIGLEGATVTLSSGDQQYIQATTTTNSTGYFNLHINLGLDSSSSGLLVIDKIGYIIYSKVIFGFSGSLSDTFALEPRN